MARLSGQEDTYDGILLGAGHNALVLQAYLGPESRNPPLPVAQRQAVPEKSHEGRLLLETSESSPEEFVLREFEHPTIQAGLLFFNALREADLRCKGFGHPNPILLASAGRALRCVGGSAASARALERPVHESGGSTLTAFDSSQAPAGHHTSFMGEKLPYRLQGDACSRDREKDAHGKAMLELWPRFAPSLDGAVMDSFTRSALDTERAFPNMKEGDLLVEPFTSSHPGGSIAGLPGYDCAQVLHQDPGLRATRAPESPPFNAMTSE